MENRVIKFRVYILDNSGKVKCYFHEWLDGDGWKHDYYAPIVSNGVFSHKELGDGFFGEIVRKRFSGLTDKHGVEIYEGDVLVSTFGNGLPFVIKFGEYHDSSGDDDLATAIGFYILEQDGTESLFGKSVNGDTDCYQVIGNVLQNLSTNHL